MATARSKAVDAGVSGARRADQGAPTVDFDALPGHWIRRLQQIAVALFLEEAKDTGITPVQYAAMQAVANRPGLDQRSLARGIGLDTSTIAGVVDRLEARGLLERRAAAEDRRVRRLHLTDAGAALLAQVVPAMRRAQRRILAPLPPPERPEFLRMLRALVDGNNALSRAPAGEAGPRSEDDGLRVAAVHSDVRDLKGRLAGRRKGSVPVEAFEDAIAAGEAGSIVRRR